MRGLSFSLAGLLSVTSLSALAKPESGADEPVALTNLPSGDAGKRERLDAFVRAAVEDTLRPADRNLGLRDLELKFRDTSGRKIVFSAFSFAIGDPFSRSEKRRNVTDVQARGSKGAPFLSFELSIEPGKYYRVASAELLRPQRAARTVGAKASRELLRLQTEQAQRPAAPSPTAAAPASTERPPERPTAASPVTTAEERVSALRDYVSKSGWKPEIVTRLGLEVTTERLSDIRDIRYEQGYFWVWTDGGRRLLAAFTRSDGTTSRDVNDEGLRVLLRPPATPTGPAPLDAAAQRLREQRVARFTAAYGSPLSKATLSLVPRWEEGPNSSSAFSDLADIRTVREEAKAPNDSRSAEESTVFLVELDSNPGVVYRLASVLWNSAFNKVAVQNFRRDAKLIEDLAQDAPRASGTEIFRQGEAQRLEFFKKALKPVPAPDPVLTLVPRGGAGENVVRPLDDVEDALSIDGRILITLKGRPEEIFRLSQVVYANGTRSSSFPGLARDLEAAMEDWANGRPAAPARPGASEPTPPPEPAPARQLRWSAGPPTSTLGAVMTADLTAVAYAEDARTPPVVERDQELRRLRSALLRPTSNSALLVGEHGVGMSALVEALADQIVHAEAGQLDGYRIVRLSLATLFAGTAFPGERQKKFLEIAAEIRKENPKTILFIDDFDHPDAADIGPQLHTVLAQNRLRVIAEVRKAKADQPFRASAVLRDAFTEIPVRAPDAAKAFKILRKMRDRELFGDDVVISDGALRLAGKQRSSRSQPMLARDTLSRAIGRLRDGPPPAGGTFKLGTTQVEKAILEATGSPADPNSPAEQKRLRGLEDALREDVLGQDSAIGVAARAIRVRRSGLGNENAPVGVFLARGEPGLGKTQLGLSIAKHLWPNLDPNDAVLEIAGETLKGAISTTQVTGAPPGYVGFDKGGIFDPLMQKPHSVLVINEMEKVDGNVLESLLTAIEKGSLKNSKGETIDLRNTVIVMTTNSEDPKADFPDAFLSRLTVLNFRPFSPATKTRLVQKELRAVEARMNAEGFGLKWNAAATDALLEHGFTPGEGNRSLQKLVADHVIGPLSNLRGNGLLPKGSKVSLGFEPAEGFEGLNFTFRSTPPARKRTASATRAR